MEAGLPPSGRIRVSSTCLSDVLLLLHTDFLCDDCVVTKCFMTSKLTTRQGMTRIKHFIHHYCISDIL